MNDLSSILSRPRLDQSQAEAFLRFLDPTSDNKKFVFQTYPERGGEAMSPYHRLIDAWPVLEYQNEHGAAVAVTINETKEGGRKDDDVTGVRAVWQEDDNGFTGTFPIEPSLVVRSSPGKFHRYWLVDGEWPADTQGRDDFKRVMYGLVRDYGSDRNATDISRCLRLPGTFNWKYGKPWPVRFFGATPEEPLARYTRAQLLEAFGVEPEPVPDRSDEPATDDDLDRAMEALEFVPADGHYEWVRVGMALHSATGGHGLGLDIWDQWSQGTQRDNYDPRKLRADWKGFRDKAGGIGLGTLFWMAEQFGWEGERTAKLADWESISEERLVIDRHSGDLTERTMAAVRETLLGYGNDPAEKFFGGMEEPAKFIQAAADGNAAIGRDFWISSLAPGVGKTTTVVEAIRALMDMDEYAKVGVVVFLSQVDQINDYVDTMRLDPQDYAVIVSKNYRDKVSLGNPFPHRAKVLLTTQQQLEARLGSGRGFAEIKDFWFWDSPRQVRIWDEAILPSKIHTVAQYDILRLLKGLVSLGQQGLVDDLETLYGKLKPAKDHDIIQMPDLDAYGIDLDKAQGQYKDEDDRDAIEALWRLSGRTVNVRRDQFGNAALGYHDVFPEDLGPLLILDASGPLRQVYTDWSTERKNLRGLYSPKKLYNGLTVHLWNKGSGNGQFDPKNDARFDLYDGFIKELKSFPEGTQTLFVCKKPSARIANIEVEITELLPWRSDYHFRTWGLHTATNDYVQCSRVMLLSVLQYPTSHNEALGRAARKLKTEEGMTEEEYNRIRYGEVMHNIYQAVNRSKVRLLIGDSCPADCHLYIRFSTRSIPKAILKRIFPGAEIVDWEPVISLRGRLQELLLMMIDEATPEGAKRTKKHFADRLGVAKQHMSGLVNDPRLVAYAKEQYGIDLEIGWRDVTIVGDRPKVSPTVEFLAEEDRVPF